MLGTTWFGRTLLLCASRAQVPSPLPPITELRPQHAFLAFIEGRGLRGGGGDGQSLSQNRKTADGGAKSIRGGWRDTLRQHYIR